MFLRFVCLGLLVVSKFDRDFVGFFEVIDDNCVF